MNPVRVDAIVDLAYGALIVLSIVFIATGETNAGIAFGVGVFSAYVVHVVWKMARFDPDWMTQTVQETVDERVEERVDERVHEEVGERVEEEVGDRIDSVRAQVEAVDERVDRRPREDRVEDLIEESVESSEKR